MIAGVINGLVNTKTWQYHRLKLTRRPANSSAKVALAFSSGDPAVIEMPPGTEGRVIQVATTADAGWTTWPLHPSYAAGDGAGHPTRPPGAAWPSGTSGSARRWTRSWLGLGLGDPRSRSPGPDDAKVSDRRQGLGRREPLPLRGDRPVGRLTARPSPPPAWPSRRPSPPTPTRPRATRLKLDKLRPQAEAVPGWKFTYLTNWKDLTGNASSVGRRGELHRPLLYALLVLLIVESIAAWKFGHH